MHRLMLVNLLYNWISFTGNNYTILRNYYSWSF